MTMIPFDMTIRITCCKQCPQYFEGFCEETQVMVAEVANSEIHKSCPRTKEGESE